MPEPTSPPEIISTPGICGVQMSINQLLVPLAFLLLGAFPPSWFSKVQLPKILMTSVRLGPPPAAP